MLSTQQIELIQTSFAQVKPIADVAATLFYDRLFTLDPALRSMFHGDMAEQGRKLMTMLAVVVNGLPRLEMVVPAVEDLGRRHGRYGVQDSHYDTVGAALLWTLEQGLGAGFTPDVREAWTAAYTVLASVMKRASVAQSAAA